MIFKFTQAETLQPLLIAQDAIVSVAAHPTDGVSWLSTRSGLAFAVLGTVEQIEFMLWEQAGVHTVAIVPVGG
jgi:hypothetical protein